MNYNDRLIKAIKDSGSCLCVGLDPNLQRLPDSVKKENPGRPEQVLSFLEKVIDATRDHCAAYKPNLGFFEALGSRGLEIFQKVIDYIPGKKIIVADVKRGDISSTAEHYAEAYFRTFEVDAVTINPLMGFETLTPFLDYPGKAVYTLTLTSNPGASDFLMKPFDNFPTMADYIADALSGMQQDHPVHLGMVIGATKSAQLNSVIQRHSKGSLLIPGIGAQGGSIRDLTRSLESHEGLPLVNSSRSILYAGENTPDWQEAVHDQALALKKELTPITQQYVS